MAKRRYWLVKTEPDVYSIEDLEREGVTEWWGIRNYQARNFMRDEMSPGDRVLVYHSQTKILGVYGIAEVAGPAHPDSVQFDPRSDYYDEKSTREDPRWWCVDLEHVATFNEPVTRDELKEEPGLADMKLLARGTRLSVMPVEKAEFELIEKMSRR
jgi:predicted RNA-binding protein with PUA-like domain